MNSGSERIESVSVRAAVSDPASHRPTAARWTQAVSRQIRHLSLQTPGARSIRLCTIALLVFATLAPPLYLVVMIQHSAITVPFWDHVEMTALFTKYFDHSLSIRDLVTHQNQPIPLCYRLIILLNGIFTNWDVRSEYQIMVAVILAGWFAHIWFIRKLELTNDMAFWACMAGVSLLYFSPVGHNNHWWSMMLQLNLTNALLVLSIVLVSLGPLSWPRHCIAAASAWLAAYTLTNGIFFFVCMVALMQLVIRPVLKPNRFSLFWIVNLALLTYTYLPGMPFEGAHPSLKHVAVFFLAYLGTPVAFLINYPYKNQFDIPLGVRWTAGVGAILLGLSCIVMWRRRHQFLLRSPTMIAAFLFASVAVVSALATAWGRAEHDEFGVAAGNSSRYSMYGAYLTLGLIYALAGSQRLRPALASLVGSRQAPWLALVAAVVVVSLGSVTFYRAVAVYHGSSVFNGLLQRAYAFDPDAEQYERLLFPDIERARRAKAQLARLHLGPYASISTETVEPPDLRFVSAAPLRAGTTLSQRLALKAGTIIGMRIVAVAPETGSSAYPIAWTLSDLKTSPSQQLASGVIRAEALKNWRRVDLQLPMITLPENSDLELQFSVPGDESPGTELAGLPLYDTAESGLADGVTLDGAVLPGRTLNVSLDLVRR